MAYPSRFPLLLAAVAAAVASAEATAQSMRFFGTGSGDIDRVKIPIDDPANGNPGPPADVGAGDFTIELWLRSANNLAGAINCGNNINWINGNIVFDRDRFNEGRAFGISLADGRVAFGIRTDGNAQRTVCATQDLRDGVWHHVAVQRDFSSGEMTIYVDGQLEQSGNMPVNEDLSYPDDGVPGNFCGAGGNQPCKNSDPFIVLGAEKHDAGSQYPSFSGWLDELRISTVVRYASNFTPPQAPFTMNAQTAALYHFDEPGGIDVLDENGNSSPGVMRIGGSSGGPQRALETPFGATPAAGALELGAAAYTAAENEPNVTLTAVRVGGSMGPVSVNWATFGSTAAAGSDYTHSMNVAAWADGDAAPKSIVVPLLDDAVFEGSETFSVVLSNVTGGAALGTRRTATVTLTDTEVPPAPGVLELTSASFAAGESDGVATITARRVTGADGDVSIAYATADGTATAGADYQAASGTLRWSNGEGAAKSFAITILNDALVEGSETLTVALSNATGGAAQGTPLTAQITIGDDDSVPGGGGGGTPSGGGSGGSGLLDLAALAALSLAASWRARKRRKI
jgi:hypothetical protein